MTDLVYDFISSGVDLIMTAAVLASVIVLLRSTNQLSQVQADQQMVADRINYYREFNVYDSHDVTGVDVVGAIIKYYKDFDMVVHLQDGGYLAIGRDGVIKRFNSAGVEVLPRPAFEAGALQVIINTDYTYGAQIKEDNNGLPSDQYEGGLLSGLVFRYKP